jgi:hypothetical protein
MIMDIRTFRCCYCSTFPSYIYVSVGDVHGLNVEFVCVNVAEANGWAGQVLRQFHESQSRPDTSENYWRTSHNCFVRGLFIFCIVVYCIIFLYGVHSTLSYLNHTSQHALQDLCQLSSLRCWCTVAIRLLLIIIVHVLSSLWRLPRAQLNVSSLSGFRQYVACALSCYWLQLK